MSLPPFSTQGSLFSTAALTDSLFGQEDRYRIFAKFVYPRLAAARSELEECYCPDNGRVAIEPVLLLGVSLLQFMDGKPDRAAVETLRYHAGWNFALNRQLGDELFHPTTLVNFRQRLIDHGMSAIGFETILEGLIEAGLIKRRGRQRLDSTQVFAKLSRMSRLECFRETMRLALQELGKKTSDGARPEFWSEIWERYVESKLDYRAESAVLQTKMSQAGLDGARLLEWIRQLERTDLLQADPLKLLDRVWNECFEWDQHGVLKQLPAPPARAVQNPHDPEAEWAAKGQGKQRKEHVGYKVQVAETVQETPGQEGEPTVNFITAMVTQPATGSDEAGLGLVEQEQAKAGLEKPTHLYVDGAYVSARVIVEAHAEGREIIGPAQPSPKKEGRFCVEDFHVVVEERKAICPAGKENTQCSRLEDQATHKVDYRFEWSSHCHDCPLRDHCVGKGQKHRTLVVGEHHSALQARRIEQKTESFKQEAKKRNAIEGTQSELVRAHGLRRARYRGLAKAKFQNYMAGAACNIKRWIRRQMWLAAQGPRPLAAELAIQAVN